MSFRHLAAALACLVFAGEICLADPTGITRGATVEGITEFRLENGLKLLLLPDDSKPTVTVNLTYLVGSRHEGYGEAGMAHLLEHMLFKGTPSHPNIPAIMKERGARFNATTSFDRTNYFETLPASTENLEFALRLESDRMINSYVAAADLATEMTVVRNEFERSENDVQRVLMQRMLATAFDWHNYGKPTIGNRADIERVPIENLQDFYHRYYRPDNALLVIAGKYDEAAALELVAKYFGTLERPKTKLNTTYTEEPVQDGERIVRLRRVGKVPLVGLLYKVPAAGHPEYPAAKLLEGVLTAEVSGRLYKSLVETKKAASVGGGTFALHDPSPMLIFAEAATDVDPAEILRITLDTLAEVVAKGVTTEEIDRVRTTILKTRELAAEDSSRLALQLSEFAAQGDWRLYFLYRDRLEQVTAEQVTAAAAKYLKADNRTVGFFEPTTEPDRTEIPQLVDLEKTVGEYKGREDVASGEQFDVSPANIDARTKRVTLRSGVKGALIEKKTRANAVTLRLALKYGTVETLKGTSTAAELLPVMMMRGTKTLSRQEIKDRFDKLRAQVSASGRPGEAVFSIRARRQTLPEVLNLLRQILREPSLPEKELELLKQAAVADLEQRLTEPEDLAQRAVERHLAPFSKDDPRYVETIAEELESLRSVDVAQLKALYSKFLSGQNGELTIVGDFDTAEVIPSIESLLDGWKTEQKYARIPRPAAAVAGGKEQIATPDKKNAYYFNSQAYPIRDTDPEYPALAIGNFILGGGALSSRLGDRIRQRDGLSYTIRSSLRSSAVDDNTVFLVEAISNPDNMPKVEKAVLEEIEKFLKEGPTDAELEQARQGWLQQQQVARSDDGNLVTILSSNLVAGRTMEHYAQLDARIGALTKDDVIKALRKRLDVKKLFLSTAGDFK